MTPELLNLLAQTGGFGVTCYFLVMLWQEQRAMNQWLRETLIQILITPQEDRVATAQAINADGKH